MNKWKKRVALQNAIDLKVSDWRHNEATNCYAFALGLDVPSDQISKEQYAYNGGVIYKCLSSRPASIRGLDHQSKIELDFKTLRLYYEQIGLFDRIISPYEWKIAFFVDIEEDFDFHFFRQGKNGIWYHKLGQSAAPTCYDELGDLITNPVYADLQTARYAYKTCYRLSRRKLK